MARKPQKEIFLSFPADEGQLEDIRISIRNILSESDLTTKDTNSVLLAIEEACTNVIRHAYLYAPGTIRIKIALHPGRVVFSIFDKGRKFDYDHSDSPDLKRYIKTGRKGGLGLYLIRKMMDSVEYYSRDGENELRLEKRAEKVAPRFIRPRGVSIRVKFALWASLVVFGIVAVVFLYFDNQAADGTSARFFRSSAEAMNSFASDIGDKIVLRDLDLSKSASAWLSANKSNFSYVVVTDTTGIIVADPEEPGNFLSDYSPLDQSYYNRDIAVEDAGGHRLFHYKRPVRLSNSIVGYVYFGLKEAPLRNEISQARRGLFLIASIGLIAGFIAVFLLSNYFVKPIQKLTEGVLRIGDGNLDRTLPVEGTDEFSEIAKAFNEITTKFKKAQDNVVEQERMQKEMQVAQEIQHALLPRRFPEMEGYDIATVYRAAKDVGGDYFDFVQIDRDTLGIIVADVSGKGVPGSLVMTMIRTALRLESRGNFSPTDVLGRVNRFVADDVKKGMFITIFFITLDSQSRTISYASAGHNPMILYRQDSDSCYFLNTRGMPLGISLPEGVEFEDSLLADKVKLKKDDMLVVYTDGITEAMNKAGEQFGNDRLISFIKGNSDLSPEDFAKKLDAEINRFTAGAPQNDDITLVVIKEKIMLDEIIFEKRKRLIQMVEQEGVPVEDACRQMDVSPSTFYKYRRRWQKLGDAGLLNKKLRAESVMKQIPYEVRKEILEIVRENPEYGTKRITDELKRRGFGNIERRGVYEELVRMRLNTKKLRLEYVDRVGSLTPEMRAELEKEILKVEEKKKEIDRDAYVEELKKSIGDKEQAGAAGFLQRLKALEGELGDAGLYKEIAMELSKLGGGDDIARLFEKMIVTMAETRKSEIARPAAGVPEEEEGDREAAAGGSGEKGGEDETSKFGGDSRPIDVAGQAADLDEEAENRKEFDWEKYGKKLMEKYNKK
jgi:serine phosphatase RsbU (regulator of sigma subunit)/anti-sigma regulatory factor (Ser/Thr protein kinase)/transposase-like protein